ncbi:hypothetical protein CHGG_10065 [Chaetomium globosum CBS 148.51]|uniref:FAD-binding FR-type domain-containing protein n=1 Tax=Chaetomium globosum (strain ATCC 6205 / CBS 148.51 / DSM 1962 / NBRC 6347 / NRRL 1970) TaxID=306901 RepID=Q2GPN9_CHAGB|nr:uncharacterized protein CHGG_10065 [Chaetomium globosum CBS 148.51]EAQ83661.1 hypothetical protein CHGG_10065 [Chaetomium globosum CBS 148.51]
MSHAGKCHHDTTEEFSSIHDDYGYKKLQECILGAVTEKTANYIKQTAEKASKKRAEDAQKQGEEGAQLALQKHRWVPVKLVDRREISDDTRTYTFELPPGRARTWPRDMPAPPKRRDERKPRKNPPTPPESPTTRFHTQPQPQQPPTPNPSSSSTPPPNNHSLHLRPNPSKPTSPRPPKPGGALSNLLDCMPLGEEVEIRGPTGDIVYLGNSEFLITGAFVPQPRRLRFPRVSLVLGGSGITPGYALMAAVMQGMRGGGGEGDGDGTEVRAVDANKSEGDILLKGELDRFERESEGRVKVTHVLSDAGEGWEGERGLVDADLLKKVLFPPEEGSAVFLCGPPGLVRMVALPALKEWGYVEDENLFGF